MPSGIAPEDREFIKKLAHTPEESLQLVIAATENGIYHWSISTDELEISRRCMDMFGLDEDREVSRTAFLQRIAHPDDYPRLQASMRRHLEHREPYEVHARFRHSNGQYIWASSQGQAAWGDDGKPYRFIGIIRNLDELEQSKRAQARAERLAKIGHFKYDIEEDHLQWSDGAFRIHGFEPGSFTPDREFARSRYIEEDRPGIVAHIAVALANQNEFEFRPRIIRDDGKVRQLVVHAEIERDANGEALSYFGSVQDITDDVQREEEIRQFQKQEALGKLVAGVAHDFNNILAVALGNAEMLRDGLSGQDQDQAVTEIIKAVERGASLSGQLLAFGRRSSLEPAEYSVGHILHDLRGMLSRVLPEKITVMTYGTPDAPPVFVDRPQLETALLNLAINARDAMPDGGRLDIDADTVALSEGDPLILTCGMEPGTYTRIQVKDTGVGVSKEMQHEIFDPFFTTKAVGEGSGLGLSMVLGFAQQSGGTVQFDSEPGVGTTVSLLLPTASGSKAELDAADQAERPTGTVRILLVEDEAPVRQVLARLLESGGHDVTVAVSGQEALAILQSGPDPEVLVTDIVMPGPVQGVELAKIARERFPGIRIVFVSGYPQEAQKEVMGWAETPVALRKPVRKEELLAAVQQSISVGG